MSGKENADDSLKGSQSMAAPVLANLQEITVHAPGSEKRNLKALVILPGADEASQPMTPKKTGATSQTKTAKASQEVTVAANLTDIIAGRMETPADLQAAKERCDLNEVVHRVLIFGLAVSTALMLTGLGLDIFRHHELPTAVPDI